MEDHVSVFEHTVQKAYEWINEVASRLEISNRNEAYRSLRAVLHSVRDQLDPNENAQLAAQLPMIVRGIYFEGWRPSGGAKARTTEDFLHAIVGHHGARPYKKPQEIAAAVFATLRSHVTGSELDQVLNRMPEQVRRVCEPVTPII